MLPLRSTGLVRHAMRPASMLPLRSAPIVRNATISNILIQSRELATTTRTLPIATTPLPLEPPTSLQAMLQQRYQLHSATAEVAHAEASPHKAEAQRDPFAIFYTKPYPSRSDSMRKQRWVRFLILYGKWMLVANTIYLFGEVGFHYIRPFWNRAAEKYGYPPLEELVPLIENEDGIWKWDTKNQGKGWGFFKLILIIGGVRMM